ncbi:hypothetical protein VN97_g648 [Penicillium thymicola]|uniref:Uncharacterized protein n=1 Tax=Penicillium thymicola TaxID=293382 RepID=A0AAI9TSE4_PENTH|nr:hypothetical protein VN97_g648 [Penicillium thymicola]
MVVGLEIELTGQYASKKKKGKKGKKKENTQNPKKRDSEKKITTASKKKKRKKGKKKENTQNLKKRDSEKKIMTEIECVSIFPPILFETPALTILLQAPPKKYKTPKKETVRKKLRQKITQNKGSALTSLSLHSHFYLRRGACLCCDVLVSVALLFRCLGSVVCLFDFCSPALDHGPYNPLSAPQD